MIEYIIPNNIDDRILKKAADSLLAGSLIAHPTDTSWHISCAYSSLEGMSKLKKLKQGAKGYTFTLIASEITQVSHVANISTSQFKLIRKFTPGPYVFILESLKKLEKITGLKRREVGFRIPDNPVCRSLIDIVKEPLFSTTAAHRMEDPNWWDPDFAEENLFEMGWELEGIPGIAMILDTGEALSKTLTTVIDFKGLSPRIIREGIGAI